MIPTIITAALALQAPHQITAPVEAPFQATENAIIVDAIVNGRKTSFMFDTGFAGLIIIDDQINIGPRVGTMNLRDFVGTFQAHTVKVDSLQIGSLKVVGTREEAVQQPLAHMSHSYGTHTDGIMGLAAVKDYVTEINFEKQKFIFHPKSVDITKRTPDNKRTFLVKMEPRGMNSIELLVETNGKPLHLALDTGNAFYATTHKESLERVGLWAPDKKPNYMQQAWVASGPVDSFYMWIPEATIYGVPVKNSIWSIIDLPSASAEDDGTIGYGFLKNFNITIDFERRHVWLENFTGKVTDDPKAEPGFRVSRRPNGSYEIWRVFPGGPADQAGIKENDILLQVDGKSLTMVRADQVQDLLEGADGSTSKIVVSRGGIIHRFEIARKVLVNGSPAS